MAKESVSSEAAADLREVAEGLHAVAIHVLRRVRRVDDETGLTAARLSALSVLVFGGPTTVGRLARAEQVSSPTMSRLVRALEREGLATREAHERDGRSVLVRATDHGRAILERGLGCRVHVARGCGRCGRVARRAGEDGGDWNDEKAKDAKRTHGLTIAARKARDAGPIDP